MAEKDTAVPAAWYLAPVPHRRDPSQCIHVSIRLWIVLPHHHSSLSWKLPKLHALHYGRCMWDASGSLLMFLWPPEEDFRCSTHKPCQNNQRQGNTICEARDHWFLMNKKWWFEIGDFLGGKIEKSSVTFAAEYSLCFLLFPWAINLYHFFLWSKCKRITGNKIEVLCWTSRSLEHNVTFIWWTFGLNMRHHEWCSRT